jgi:uncharacterized membrane protein YkgB
MSPETLTTFAFLFVFLFVIAFFTIIFFIPEIISGGKCVKEPSIYGDTHIKDKFRDTKMILFYVSLGFLFVSFILFTLLFKFNLSEKTGITIGMVFLVFFHIGFLLLISAITSSSLDNTSTYYEKNIAKQSFEEQKQSFEEQKFSQYNIAKNVSGGLGAALVVIGAALVSTYKNQNMILLGVNILILGISILIGTLPIIFHLESITRTIYKINVDEIVTTFYTKFIGGASLSSLIQSDLTEPPKTYSYNTGESISTIRKNLLGKITGSDKEISHSQFYEQVKKRTTSVNSIINGLETLGASQGEISEVTGYVLTNLANNYYTNSEYVMVGGDSYGSIIQNIEGRVSSGNITENQKTVIISKFNAKTPPPAPVTDPPVSDPPVTDPPVSDPSAAFLIHNK